MSTPAPLPHREPLTFSVVQLNLIRGAGLVGNDVHLANGELVARDGSPHRWTVPEAIALTQMGIITERTELLAGRLLRAVSIDPSHSEIVKLLTKSLVRAVGDMAETWAQNPIQLTDDSALQPAVALVEPRSYAHRYPRPEDTFLVIEVAGPSEARDRADKLPRYAAAGIPEAWLVCLESRTVEVYREQLGDHYRSSKVLHPGDELVALRIPAARVAVADLFS